jgi:hypothetical protein
MCMLLLPRRSRRVRGNGSGGLEKRQVRSLRRRRRRRVAQGSSAFGRLFDRYARVVLQFLLRRVDPGDADVLLGEMFRIAFRRREAFDLTADSARPWL